MPPSLPAAPARPLQLIAICLFGLAGAGLARLLGGYPTCRMDEHNWAAIAQTVQSGVDWPVSGPLHFWALQHLMRWADASPSTALAVLGTLSVPLLLALLWASYRLLGLARPAHVLLCLCTCSFFLAPLLESRPQQWGQVLVLLALALCLRGLQGKGPWWPYLLLAPLVALLHILSFAILAAASLLLAMGMYAAGAVQPARLAGPVAGAALGLLVFVLPGSPYGPMLADIRDHHLLIHTTTLAAAALGGLLAAVALTLLAKQCWPAWRQAARRPLEWVDDHPAWAIAGLLLAAILALLVQAAMLPPQAWVPYQGSFPLFLASQAGNLFFLYLLLQGLLAARQQWLWGHDRTSLRTLGALLLTAGVLAVAALLASAWLLHTNWMLRVLNYGVLWAAPFAALGLARRARYLPLWVVYAAAVAISLVATLRPPGLYNC